MTHEMADWKQIATILQQALPQIDQTLSQANVPISHRKLQAFDIVRDTMLEVSDSKVFLLSKAHGRILIIVGDWYRSRYGDAVDDDDEFVSLVLIHETPFVMQVPKSFRIPANEPNMAWIGFPASVQAEEDPLSWIPSKGVVDGLSTEEVDDVRTAALETANMVRSIGFDVRSLEHDQDSTIAELSGSVRADLQSSARSLCERTEAALRSASWSTSQPTEKVLKLFIRRRGQTPAHTHKLAKLANQAESLGAQAIDRTTLAPILSGHDATGIRYGGDMTLSKAVDAYSSALSIIKQILFEAKPDAEYNIREARFKIQKPPWFNFDTRSFRECLRE